MGNHSSRQYTYQQYYSAIQQAGNISHVDFKSIDMDSLNPYEVLNVSKKFTWEELKEAYRKLAINTHPDKEGGNKDLFNIITHCFKKLAVEYKNREADRQHFDLKKQSVEYFDRMTGSGPGGNIEHPSEVLKPSKDITNEVFNKNFDKCRVQDDDTEFGYGSIMDASSKIRDDINIERVIKKDKVDNESFNSIFNKKVPISKQLVKYKEPEPLLLAKNLQFTELGGKKPDDYTSSMEKNNTLAYTDYMKAHDGTRLVDPDIIKKMKDFKSVEEYEKYRNNKIKRELTTKERKLIEDKKLKEEREEFERLERLKTFDKKVEKSYEKANRLFLK
jgi:curved DNA-binding protein CbpA